jgi:hypothetical protein
MVNADKLLLAFILLPTFNLACSGAYGQDQPPVARLSHQMTRGQKANSPAKTSTTEVKATKTEVKASEHVTRHSLPKPNLVPPPPPGAYLGSPMDFMSPGMMVQPEYQSPAQLKQSLLDVTDQLTRASKALDDKKTSDQEKKDRAKQFVSLYSEGVISKRELETAQSDATSLEDVIKDLQAKVEMLKQNKASVELALKKLNKSAKPAKESKSENKLPSDNAHHENAIGKTPAAQ